LNSFDGTTPKGSLRSGEAGKILCRISNIIIKKKTSCTRQKDRNNHENKNIGGKRERRASLEPQSV